MAQATGAPLLISNCPFCLTMFEDGIKTGGAEGRLQVKTWPRSWPNASRRRRDVGDLGIWGFRDLAE